MEGIVNLPTPHPCGVGQPWRGKATPWNGRPCGLQVYADGKLPQLHNGGSYGTVDSPSRLLSLTMAKSWGLSSDQDPNTGKQQKAAPAVGTAAMSKDPPKEKASIAVAIGLITNDAAIVLGSKRAAKHWLHCTASPTARSMQP